MDSTTLRANLYEVLGAEHGSISVVTGYLPVDDGWMASFIAESSVYIATYDGATVDIRESQPSLDDSPVQGDRSDMANLTALEQQTDSADDLMEVLLGWRTDAGKGKGGARKKRSQKPNCTKGRSCGMSCIPRAKQCKADLSPAAKAVADSIAGSGGGAGTGGNQQPRSTSQPETTQRQAPAPQAAPPPAAPKTPSAYTPPSRDKALRQFDELGRGGFGVVVLDRENNVAIKYGVSATAPAASAKEVSIMKKASDLGVGPKILNNDNKAIAMEFLDGYKTFYNFKEMQDMGLDGQKQMAKNYLQQLERLHSAGITHNDMFGGNVMFNPATQDVRIIDYGLSKEGGTRVGGADFAGIRKSFGAQTDDLLGDGSEGFQVMRHPSVDAVLAKAERGTTQQNRAEIFRELYDAIDKIDDLPTFDFEDDF